MPLEKLKRLRCNENSNACLAESCAAKLSKLKFTEEKQTRPDVAVKKAIDEIGRQPSGQFYRFYSSVRCRSPAVPS